MLTKCLDTVLPFLRKRNHSSVLVKRLLKWYYHRHKLEEAEPQLKYECRNQNARTALSKSEYFPQYLPSMSRNMILNNFSLLCSFIMYQLHAVPSYSSSRHNLYKYMSVYKLAVEVSKYFFMSHISQYFSLSLVLCEGS